MSAEIIVIAAMARNRAIGLNGKLPWHIPEDLKRFRSLTMGHFCIMGRKTFESLPGPLPGRGNIVLSTNYKYRKELPRGVLGHENLREAIWDAVGEFGMRNAFVIGGKQVFAEALPWCHRLFLTEIQGDFEGDTFFPEFSGMREIYREKRGTHKGLGYHFVQYVRSPRS